MEQQITKEDSLRALRAAIRSVKRAPIKVTWPSDERFYIELRMPKFAERLDLQLTAQLTLAGLGGTDRLIQALPNLIVSFRLPVEDDEDNLMQAVFNAEPLPDIPVINLSPSDLFSDKSDFNATPVLMTLIITAIMELSGRTRTLTEGVNQLMELFPTTSATSANVLDEGSIGLSRP